MKKLRKLIYALLMYVFQFTLAYPVSTTYLQPNLILKPVINPSIIQYLVTKSTRPGMGSIPYSGGVTFRVWAPNATKMAVFGDFNNNGTETAIPMASEGNGYWSRDISGITSGFKYRYQVNGTALHSDPYSRKMEHSAGKSIVYEPTGAVALSQAIPFEKMVIYQLHVGSFGASTTTVGKFADVKAKISYIKGLGVNMVELLPTTEFPGDDGWGYNPSAQFAVESYYGGPEKLIELINAFHAQGIGVILDLVINHHGNGDNQLWEFDGWKAHPDHGGIYFYSDWWKAQNPWGDWSRYDFGRSEVRQYLHDQSVYFIEKFKVDGLRYDATSFITKWKDKYFTSHGTCVEGEDLVKWINDDVHYKNPSAITIAEDMEENTYVTKPYGYKFNSQWDSFFFNKVRAACKQYNWTDANMYDVRDALNWSGGAMYNQVNYTESHDEVGGPQDQNPKKYRLVKEIDWYSPGSWKAKKKSTLGAALVFMGRGIPMIFQGQEFMEDKRFECMVDNESIVNRPSWTYTTTYAGITQLYKDLISLKKNYSSFQDNNINVFHVDNNNKVIAFHRWSGSENFVIIVNFGDKQWPFYGTKYYIGWPQWKTGYCKLNSDWNGYSSDFGNFAGWNMSPESGGMDGLGQKAEVKIERFSFQVYQLY